LTTRWISTAFAALSRFFGIDDDDVWELVVVVVVEEVVAGNGTSIGTRATSEMNSRDERPGTCQNDLVLDDVLGCPRAPWAASLRGETGA
jgi:hypothetical protein